MQQHPLGAAPLPSFFRPQTSELLHIKKLTCVMVSKKLSKSESEEPKIESSTKSKKKGDESSTKSKKKSEPIIRKKKVISKVSFFPG